MGGGEKPLFDPSQPPLFFFRQHSPLSNWFVRDFVIKGICFPHMECFLMYCKAKLFDDHETALQILNAEDQQRCKNLGRQVRGYIDEVWANKREQYAFIGGKYRYAQNQDLLEFLLASGMRELVEASPYDRLWGIGMSAADPQIGQRELWGLNLQGKISMRLRQYFQEAAL